MFEGEIPTATAHTQPCCILSSAPRAGMGWDGMNWAELWEEPAQMVLGKAELGRLKEGQR